MMLLYRIIILTKLNLSITGNIFLLNYDFSFPNSDFYIYYLHIFFHSGIVFHFLCQAVVNGAVFLMFVSSSLLFAYKNTRYLCMTILQQLLNCIGLQFQIVLVWVYMVTFLSPIIIILLPYFFLQSNLFNFLSLQIVESRTWIKVTS